MTAKDIALLAWCIARLELHAKQPIFQKTFRIMEKYVEMLIDGVLKFKLNDEVYSAEFEEQIYELVTEKTGA